MRNQSFRQGHFGNSQGIGPISELPTPASPAAPPQDGEQVPPGLEPHKQLVPRGEQKRMSSKYDQGFQKAPCTLIPKLFPVGGLSSFLGFIASAMLPITPQVYREVWDFISLFHSAHAAHFPQGLWGWLTLPACQRHLCCLG